MFLQGWLRLLQIESITLDNAQQILPRSNMYSAKAMNYDSSPVIGAGDIKIVANVTIIYEIAPQWIPQRNLKDIFFVAQAKLTKFYVLTNPDNSSAKNASI